MDRYDQIKCSEAKDFEFMLFHMRQNIKNLHK